MSESLHNCIMMASGTSRAEMLLKMTAIVQLKMRAVWEH